MLNRIRLTKSSHWKFFKAGGLLQVSLGSAEDLARLEELDPKLWVALAYPVTGVEFDEKTLSLIDSDNDGRVRPPEIIEAVRWATLRMSDTEAWFRGEAPLSTTHIRPEAPDSERLIAAMRHILEEKGEPEGYVTVADVVDFSKRCSEFTLNGDGIIPPEAACEEELRNFLADVLLTVGGEADKSGKEGVSAALLERYLEEAKAALEWRKAEKADPAVLFLGENTSKAFESFAAVREKVDDYFFRCRLFAFDPRVGDSWSFGADTLAALSSKGRFEVMEASGALPLARISHLRPLPLAEGVNPTWLSRIGDFASDLVFPLLGDNITEISENDWAAINEKIGPYCAWYASKPATPLAERDEQTLEEILSSPSVCAASALMAEDLAKAEDFKLIDTLERLVRYRRDLPVLLRNFINFADFYDPDGLATFQVGTLYLDARSCELCFSVDDIGKHSSQSVSSKMFLAYCEIQRRSDGLKKTICAAFTAGGSQTLWIGRSGVFYDRTGRDWDATIVKVVENSISLKESFWSPWRKMARMVGEQVNKLIAAKESSTQASFKKGVEETGQSVSSGQPPVQPVAVQQAGGAAMASSVAALGIALGFISTAATAALGLLTGMPLWKTMLAIMGLFLMVSGPSMVLCYFRIRSRDLAPVLNACGWAVNKSIPLPIKLARRLTREAEIPASAALSAADDPYDDEKENRKTRITVLLVILALSLVALYFLRIR
jgi:hypothetical protein